MKITKKGIVGTLIGLMVAMIVLMSVLLPSVSQFVSGGTASYNTTNLSGYTSANVVAQLFPLLIVIIGVMMIVGIYAIGRD